MYKAVLFILFFGLQYIYAFNDPKVLKKVDESLLVAYQTQAEAEYIVILKDKLVFNQPLPFQSKNEKGNYVYQALLKHAEKTQRPIIKLLNGHDVEFQAFFIINAIKVKSDKSLMMDLAALPAVEQIINDAPMKMLDYFQEKSQGLRSGEPEWGIKYIKADSVWMSGITGQGVVIAGQDTGYDWEVSPIKTKYRGYIDSLHVDHNYNWFDAIIKNSPHFPDTILNPCGLASRFPCDDNNHGTHTMGTMVGQDDDNNIGVAPGAKWIACRNMDRGWGQPSTYINCFEWFLAPRDLDGLNPDPTKAPHVINNSWFCSVEEGCNASNFALMEDVVKNVKAAGIVVVVSAGNSGSSCGSVTGPPAFFESSFSVGATDINGNIAGFSSRGPVVIDSSFRLKPNASAPGVNVRSVIRGGGFANLSGTSMAGPHMAGVVALIISANPKLAGNVETIEDIIESTAIVTTSDQTCGEFDGSLVPNAVFGYGIVNAYEAVQRAKAFNTGINQPEISKVIVFPNPSDDLISFNVGNGSQTIKTIKIFDIQGQKVIEKYEGDGHLLTTLSISQLQFGTYTYLLQTDDKIYYGKFVKL